MANEQTVYVLQKIKYVEEGGVRTGNKGDQDDMELGTPGKTAEELHKEIAELKNAQILVAKQLQELTGEKVLEPASKKVDDGYDDPILKYEGTMTEVILVYFACFGFAIGAVAFFLVICIVPLASATWSYNTEEDGLSVLKEKVVDWMPPSAADAGAIERTMEANVDMAILLQTIVQLGANPFYIMVQMRALCGFWGFQDPYVMIPNILYGLWIIIAPLCTRVYFWYYWIDFTVGGIYMVVEAIYAYRMIGRNAKEVGTIDTGNDIVPFQDRPKDMTGKIGPAQTILFSSGWVILLVYIVVPMTVAGWFGYTTGYGAATVAGKAQIVIFLQAVFQIAIPVVRTFLAAKSPLGPQADMLILMHPSIHKAITSRMLVASLDAIEELILVSAVLSFMEVLSRIVFFPLKLEMARRRGNPIDPQELKLYSLSRSVDQILEIMCILGCPLCMYMFQNESIIFTFALGPGSITGGVLLMQIFVQLAFETVTDFVCLYIEIMHLKFNLLKVAVDLKRNMAYVRFVGYSVLTMGLLYFIYISTKFPRYPCPDPDWCACNGNMETCFTMSEVETR